MLTVTRYKAARIAKVTEAVFSKMWTRHQREEQYYDFFSPEGKIDIDHKSFHLKYGNKININEIEALREKLNNKKKPKIKIKPLVKKEPKIKKIPEVKIKEPDKPIIPVGINLAQEKTKWEIENLKSKDKKQKLEYEKNRNKLLPRDEMDRVYGFLDALNKNIMGIPLSIIDDFEAAVKTKNTRSNKIGIITGPICEAIAETKTAIKKELASYIREKKKIEIIETLDE